MKQLVQASWPEWPKDGLEYIDHCPVCFGPRRSVLYTGLRDRLFNAPGDWTMYKCHDCGIGYLNPRPTPETIGLAYKDYQTHVSAVKAARKGFVGKFRDNIRNGYLNRKYGYQLTPGAAWGFWLMHLLPHPIRWEQDQYARHLLPPTASGQRLLDIGCGNGEFLINARSAGWLVNGIEPDPNAASVGQQYELPIHVGTYDSVELQLGSFDTVTANQVIEHVHDPHDFASRIRGWLKPSGRVWIGTPNLDCRMHRTFRRDYVNLHPPQHLAMFTPAALQRLFGEHGFRNIRFIKRGFHDYNQYLGSAALTRGKTGPEVYRGVKNAPLTDKVSGILYELAAWSHTKACSDLVMVAEKDPG